MTSNTSFLHTSSANFTENIAPYRENLAEHLDTQCGQTLELLNVRTNCVRC